MSGGFLLFFVKFSYIVFFLIDSLKWVPILSLKGWVEYSLKNRWKFAWSNKDNNNLYYTTIANQEINKDHKINKIRK